MALAPISPFGGVDAVAFYRNAPGLDVLRQGGPAGGVSGAGALGDGDAAGSVEASGFKELLGDKLGAAMKLEAQGAAAAQSLATGTAEDISAATIAVQKAAISMQLVGAVRNKALEAYQDVMRMQV